MLVFAYSITPKIALHNLVADHVDAGKQVTTHGDELSTTGFNCKCDNLVAESPFVLSETQFEIPGISSKATYCEDLVSLKSSDKLYLQLRGPPALI